MTPFDPHNDVLSKRQSNVDSSAEEEVRCVLAVTVALSDAPPSVECSESQPSKISNSFYPTAAD